MRNSFASTVLVGVTWMVLVVAIPPQLACAQASQPPYDLTRLEVVNNVLAYIRQRYVEPRRLAPREMLKRALEEVAKQVPEVIVRFKPAANAVELQVDTAVRAFSLAAVDSPWALSTALRVMFRFIQGNLQKGTKRRRVEYAAVDGLLKTLDCHSVLMRPRSYSEMRIHTRGTFGGLGITISRCGHPQVLTILKPIPGTPAAKAGLRAGDRIVRIGRASTENLTLNEAVKRLRGKAGSKITIVVQRPGAGGFRARPTVLERAEIQLDAVEWRVLAGDLGYIKLKNFQSTTTDELRKALARLKLRKVRGIVLDLRDNGGGLLSKAVDVADAFLYAGTIVTTVGHGGTRRVESRARWGTTLMGKVPMAILVNSGTASASEIVAGALKNLDRAVIIGERTYGKGSVQMIFRNSDNSALKVTIAQYLTPGDMSIQGIGVIPDIELRPVRITKKRITYFSAGASTVREADRVCSLRRLSLASRRPARWHVDHLADKLPRAFRCEPCGVSKDWETPVDDEVYFRDYAIRLAEKVLLSSRSASRRRVLAGLDELLKRERVSQEKRIVDKVRKVSGVDWSAAPKTAVPPRLEGRVIISGKGVVTAGARTRLTVTVHNAGAAPAHRVRALLSSTNLMFHQREVLFGVLKPGETRKASILVRIPRGARARTDELRLRLFAGARRVKAPVCEIVRTQPVPKPKFVYTREILDEDGDGVLRPGEKARLRVRVRNVGTGAAGETYLRLKSLSGDGVLVRRGLAPLTGLRPGQTKTVTLRFKIYPKMPAKMKRVRVQITVGDCELGPSVGEKIWIPVERDTAPLETLRGTLVATAAKVAVRDAPRNDAHVLGYLVAGVRLPLQARIIQGKQHYYVVGLAKRGRGFVAAGRSVRVRRAGARGTVTWRWLPSPPVVKLAQTPRVVGSKSLLVSGTAVHGTRIRDVSILVSRLIWSAGRERVIGADFQKIFYRANRVGAKHSMKFQARVPLWPGSNLVRILVRQNSQVQTVRRLRVLRSKCSTASGASPGAKRPHASLRRPRIAPAIERAVRALPRRTRRCSRCGRCAGAGGRPPVG